jgi:hypothetical protein
MGASIVLGQAGFGTGTAAVTQAGMNGPRGIWASDSRVAVADTRNNRVLLYDRLGAGGEIANGRNADLVLGQPDFVSNLANNGGVNSQSLNTPTGVWSDGTRLFVVDAGNQRVLIWNSWPAIDQQPADRVVGQTNFLANSANQGSLLPNAYSLQHPFHALVHMGRLIVTDGAWIGNSGQFDTFQNSLPANVTTNSRVLFVPSW